MNLTQLHEGHEDAVTRLIQREMWPIATQLEKTLKSGQIVTMRDKDGSVLIESKAKANEIVDQYTGINAEMHRRAIDKATDYQDVQKILTNVLLKNKGYGVVK